MFFWFHQDWRAVVLVRMIMKRVEFKRLGLNWGWGLFGRFVLCALAFVLFYTPQRIHALLLINVQVLNCFFSGIQPIGQTLLFSYQLILFHTIFGQSAKLFKLFSNSLVHWLVINPSCYDLLSYVLLCVILIGANINSSLFSFSWL